MKASIKVCTTCGGKALWGKTPEGKWALFEYVMRPPTYRPEKRGRHSCKNVLTDKAAHKQNVLENARTFWDIAEESGREILRKQLESVGLSEADLR